MSYKILNIAILCLCVCLGAVIFAQQKAIKDLERQYNHLYSTNQDAFTMLLDLQKDVFCPLYAKDETNTYKQKYLFAKCSVQLPSNYLDLLKAYRKKRLEQDLKNGLY